MKVTNIGPACQITLKILHDLEVWLYMKLTNIGPACRVMLKMYQNTAWIRSIIIHESNKQRSSMSDNIKNVTMNILWMKVIEILDLIIYSYKKK